MKTVTVLCDDYGRDALEKMNDNDIIDTLIELKKTIELCTRANENAQSFEVAYCYVQDEAQRRAPYNDRMIPFVTKTEEYYR